MVSLDEIRKSYAEEICRSGNVQSASIKRSFAQVAREEFVGKGPWRILDPDNTPGGYQNTPDDNPIHIYRDVLVALNEVKGLNNGHPSSLAAWIDSLDPQKGERVLHVGCGVGYYTAILSLVVEKTGRVVGVEVDHHLADKAKNYLAAFSQAQVALQGESSWRAETYDAIFINAGATMLDDLWIQSLSYNGRLLVPLTVSDEPDAVGFGEMLLVKRNGDIFEAKFTSPVGIYPCIGQRNESGNKRLKKAFRGSDSKSVKSLRVDDHQADDSCWVHLGPYCLSTKDPGSLAKRRS